MSEPTRTAEELIRAYVAANTEMNVANELYVDACGDDEQVRLDAYNVALLEVERIYQEMERFVEVEK